MYAQKLSFDYAHTLHTVRIVHNAHSVHRSRVQKGQSCDCINFVRATDSACGTAGFLVSSSEYIREKLEDSMTDAQWENFDGPGFTGFDTDPTILRISAMNLMLHFKGTVDAESINDNLKAITNTKIQEKQLQNRYPPEGMEDAFQKK